jgi:Fe-S oxidoreductase
MSDKEPKVPMPELADAVVELGGQTLHDCMQCGLCFAVCPWRKVEGEISDEFNIRRVQHMAQLGVDGYESDNVILACTTCGICKLRCPRGVEPAANVRTLRSMIMEGESVRPQFRPILGSLRNDGNPWSGKRAARFDWAADLDLPQFGADTEYLLFVCCTSCYDGRCRDIAKALVSVLKKAGVSFGVIGEEESCCGESARKIGGEEEFMSLAEKNIKLFQDKGVKKIITTSPHCLYSFRQEYPELGGEFEAIHYAQLLAQLVEDGSIQVSGELAKKIIYHDPCYLGRHNEEYEAPRNVIGAVTKGEQLEMENNRAESICCGGGGGRIWLETDAGARFGDIRIADAVSQEADIVATACPYCTIMLDASNPDQKVQVKDIAEILDEVL